MTVYFKAESVVHATDKAVLIKIEKGNNHKGACFWIPKKLTKPSGKNSEFISVWFPNNEFELKLGTLDYQGNPNMKKAKDAHPSDLEDFGFKIYP